MISRVYVERAVREHPRTGELLRRLRNRPVIDIEHYREVFNPRAQNFRLQKKHPALIIAHKNHGQVLPTPAGYGLDGEHHYYFSHMLNCIYDCRYCFLQGMYQSAHQVLFVNYEDFGAEIERTAKRHGDQPVWFYSGYDCDSLANEPMTGFAEYFIPRLSSIDNAWLELRTKSTQVRKLLEQEPFERVVTAFSFSDAHSHARLEHGVPSIDRRLDAMRRLQQAGWPLGLRFDPVIYHPRYQEAFSELVARVFEVVDAQAIHSVSLGNFRLTRDHFRQVVRLYPEEPLFAQPLTLERGIVSYSREREAEMMSYCEDTLMRYVPAAAFQPCDWHGEQPDGR